MPSKAEVLHSYFSVFPDEARIAQEYLLRCAPSAVVDFAPYVCDVLTPIRCSQDDVKLAQGILALRGPTSPGAFLWYAAAVRPDVRQMLGTIANGNIYGDVHGVMSPSFDKRRLFAVAIRSAHVREALALLLPQPQQLLPIQTL